MIHALLARQVHQWLERPDCPVRSVVDYIEARGQLRPPQIEAIKTYLFLKIEGGNKPLWQLFSAGAFTRSEDLSQLQLSQPAREALESDAAALALFEFARARNEGDVRGQFPDLEDHIKENVGAFDAQNIVKNIFYGVDYPDYLFSLPMGAGKTYLMAAFIYLDLYFALNEPENKAFAHNFIVLVPSGLKTSILPSIKTIEKFDPTWVLPEPAASEVKQLIHFEVLDQGKTAKKSNKARNPNAQKVSGHQPFESLMGLVLVTNAEKVILDRVTLNAQGQLFEQTEDDKDKTANELRNIIGKILHLQIHIDEVHHAATDEVKLRQVVTQWAKGGTINGVLGYSGTPYLASPDKVEIGAKINLKFSQITNTVYYYPLKRAIETFLKKPTVKSLSGLEPLEIVRLGVTEFYEKFESTVYENNTVAKLAIYCGKIDRLEEEIYPLLLGEMGIPAEHILKFHQGNKEHPIAPEAKLEFESLDTDLSEKRIVLLVQIGKEGWDCKSLAGVILSQKGDSPANMVLQTSCRCLRQVTRGQEEHAGIWLNAENAKLLDKQLKAEQNTSIAEINSIAEKAAPDLRERVGRVEFLKLPPVDFFQLQVRYDTLVVEENPQPKEKIAAVKAADWKTQAMITERGLTSDDVHTRVVVQHEQGERADFGRWLGEVRKASFGAVGLDALWENGDALRPLFEQITFEQDGERLYNSLYDEARIASLVRLAFHARRELQTHSEVVPQEASLLLVEKLAPIGKEKTLYPDEKDSAEILAMDANNQSAEAYEQSKKDEIEKAREVLKAQGIDVGLLAAQSVTLPVAVRQKDRSFHFLPYNFSQSKFELEFLRQALTLEDLKARALELYFNGENHLTEFRIECHEQKGKQWRRVGLYTPDFLLLERNATGAIHRVLIIETKGSGFADQKSFMARRNFVEGEFLRLNNEKFGYARFEYLYISDADEMTANLTKLSDAIAQFFTP